MATVISLTEQKIRTLLSGWETIGLSQDEINALIAQLAIDQDSVNALMAEFQNVTLPAIEQDVAAASISISDLNGTVIPNLEAELNQADLQIQNLVMVDIPAIQAGLNNEIEGTKASPSVFVQPDEPPAYDDLEERDLVVGDTWFDSDDEYLQRFWDGVAWTTLRVDIQDLAAEVIKHLSPEHALYKAPVTGSLPVTNGANITAT